MQKFSKKKVNLLIEGKVSFLVQDFLNLSKILNFLFNKNLTASLKMIRFSNPMT